MHAAGTWQVGVVLDMGKHRLADLKVFTFSALRLKQYTPI